MCHVVTNALFLLRIDTTQVVEALTPSKNALAECLYYKHGISVPPAALVASPASARKPAAELIREAARLAPRSRAAAGRGGAAAAGALAVAAAPAATAAAPATHDVKLTWGR